MGIFWTLLCILTVQPLLAAGQSSIPQLADNLTAQQIASRLAENNRKRQRELQGYTGQRLYRLLYTGFPGRRQAELVVGVKYEAPADKQFTIISQSGSRGLTHDDASVLTKRSGLDSRREFQMGG